jgi:hypothetical protein
VYPIKIIPAALFVLLSLWPPFSFAAPDDMPAFTVFSAPETHIPIRLRPGKPQVVHLEAEAGDVTVDDMPGNVSAVIYGPKSIVLFPRAAGGAHFTVLGKNGETLMARYVVINGPPQKYFRLRQVCREGAAAGCAKDRVYYCPNLCYETTLVGALAGQRG